jgi:phosphotriesterase-related protein
MTTVNTVLGTLDTAELGFTLMHEHVMVAASGIYTDYPSLFGDDPVARAVARLRQAKEGGVDTLVDATTHDLGRNAPLLAAVSEQSEVNIILCTGWWLDVPRFMRGVTADQMARLFVRDVEEGFADTGIRAGILKSAADQAGVTPELEVMARAAARAQLQTGLPLMIHSFPTGQVGRRQIAILKEEGVDLGRVKIDHSNDTTDVEYLSWILDQGCYLGLDRYPGGLVSSSARTRTLKALMDAGYTDRLCPSHDHISMHVIPEKPDGSMPGEGELTARNPHGYLYIKNVVFPELRDMGVSDDTLTKLFVDNPRRFFEGG